MKTVQQEIAIDTPRRGFIEITDSAQRFVAEAGIAVGLLHAFVRHTSCSLIIQENADPTVLGDVATMLERWAPDGDPAYRHRLEGPDDMAAHLRMMLTGAGQIVPIAGGRLALGTWQGLFLCEHRARGSRRRIVFTAIGQ